MTIPSGTRRRQQAVARWAKKTPGYRWALTEVLPRIRRSPVLSDLAWRIFAPRHGAGYVDVALQADQHVHGPDVRTLPVVGVLATGLTDGQAEALMDHVAELQEQTQAFRPLFLLDRPVFAAARVHGYVVEHLVPRVVWADGDFGTVQWQDYVGRRIASVIDTYQLWHLVRVPQPEGDDGPRLDPTDLAVLRALPQRLARVAADRQSTVRPSRVPSLRPKEPYRS